MRIAARIQRIRLESLMTVEDLEMETGLRKGLIARLEDGRAVPTLETLDILADALDVPVHRFFYDDGEPNLTPRLTPRISFEELAEESQGPVKTPLSSKPRRPVRVVINLLVRQIEQLRAPSAQMKKKQRAQLSQRASQLGSARRWSLQPERQRGEVRRKTDGEVCAEQIDFPQLREPEPTGGRALRFRRSYTATSSRPSSGKMTADSDSV
jgi:transcriptional regulator with XRE-family HTH domain